MPRGALGCHWIDTVVGFNGHFRLGVGGLDRLQVPLALQVFNIFALRPVAFLDAVGLGATAMGVVGAFPRAATVAFNRNVVSTNKKSCTCCGQFIVGDNGYEDLILAVTTYR